MENQELINDNIKPKDTIYIEDLGLKRSELMNILLNIVFFVGKILNSVFVARWVFFKATLPILLSKLFKYTREHFLPPPKLWF